MKVVDSSVLLISNTKYETLLSIVERAGRICYKSENLIKEDSAENFIRSIIKRGHESVLEHGVISVKIICDRGVSHELVRHRLASYSQESTRYCNYSQDKFGNEITVVLPTWLSFDSKYQYNRWYTAMENAEKSYFDLINHGAKPQEARAVLPNSLKTEVIMTANIREWRHFLKLRTAAAAHPDMRVIAKIIYNIFKSTYPVFFEDIEVENE